MSTEAGKSQLLIILLKGSVDDQESNSDLAYFERLSPAVVRRIPVLEFEGVGQNLEIVFAQVYDAILVSSTRAIWALREYASPQQLTSLRTATWFVVGKATAEAVIACVQPICILGSDTGNAERLMELLASQEKKPRNVCFICGNLRKSTIEDGLRDCGIPFALAEVYRTIPIIQPSIPAAPQGHMRICVFFSPSGVTAAHGALQSDDKLVAIGETTAKALASKGLKTSAVASEPSPEGLVQAITSLIEGDGS
jgi:uroporphyrinogen-III synthase